MIFNGDGIHLTASDCQTLEYDGKLSLDWSQFHRLHRIVTEMFAAEWACEWRYWDNTRQGEDSFHFSFMSECLPEFTTHRLGQMAVSLDSIAGVQ